jgi:hypothetical protein
MVAVTPVSLAAPYVVQPYNFRTTSVPLGQTIPASDNLAQQNTVRLNDALTNANTTSALINDTGDGPVPSATLAGDTLLQAQEAFNAIDSDDNGNVTLEEFQNGAGINPEINEDSAADLETLFTQSDLDANGILSEGEFTSGVLYETLSSVVDDLSNPALQVGTPVPATFYDPRDTNLDGIIDAQERLADLLGGITAAPTPALEDESLMPGTEEARNSMMSYLISVQEAQQGLA